MKKYFSIFSSVLLTGAAAICASCEILDEQQQSGKNDFSEIFKKENFVPDGDGVLELRRFAGTPDDNVNTIEIISFDDEPVHVGRMLLLSAKDIVSMKALERVNDPGRYNIELTLTPDGVNRWNVLSRNIDERIAFIKDGVFIRSFFPRRIYDPATPKVVIDGPFDSGVAFTLEKAAPEKK